jgi:RNA polymerase sigma factor (sigma-70 family)
MRIVRAPDQETPEGSTFEAFYRAEYPGAVRLVWLLTHDAGACDDVVQDAFTAVFRRFDSLDRPGAYLRSSVVNRVCELGRRGQREQRRVRLVSARPDEQRDGSATADLADVIVGLPHQQRAAVVLRYWADLPETEIAELLGVRPATVRSLVSRALTQLRKEIPR